jgi:hypothetical protein
MQHTPRILAIILCCLFSLAPHSGAFAKDKEPKTYPEQGTVVATRTQEQSHTTPIYTDPYGKTHGGTSAIRRLPVYRIETSAKFYELEGKKKQPLVLGDTIRFRLEKQWAYVQQEADEQKLRVVGVELKQGK